MPTTHASWTSPLLELLFEEAGAARCLVAPDGSVVRVNSEWLRSTGCTADDVIGVEALDLFPELRETAIALHARATAGHHVELPRHARRVHGRDVWWEGGIDPVPMEGGAGLLITAREVDAPSGGEPGLRQRRPYADPACGSVFDVVNDAIFVHDPVTGVVLDVNRTAEEMFETTRDVIRSCGVEGLSLGEPPYAASEAHALIQAASEGKAQLFEWRAKTWTGRPLWVEVNLKRVSADGCDRLIAVVRDITQRKRSEEALRESEHRLRLLANAMPQIVCVLGPDGQPEYVNPAWVGYSGLDLAETRRVGWERVLHPDDLAAARECRARVLMLLAPQEAELRYRAADGSFRWFLGRVAPELSGGRVVRLVGAAMDIEERKRAEQILHEQLALKDQLAKVAESAPGVVCSFRLRPDGTTCLPFSSPAIRDLYGFAADELARDMSPALARTHPDDLPQVQHAIAESGRTMKPWRAIFRYDHPTKGMRWMQGASIPSREPDGSILWHGYVADVTDHRHAVEGLREANERLREADRRKDEFLGMLSHELRNPLAPIRNSVFLLRRSHDPAQAELAIQVIDRQAAHLTRLVDDLLDVTRIARGKIQLRPERIDLRELVMRTGDDFRPVIEERGVAYRVVVPRERVWVRADPTRVAQVIGNLLHNAAKFTRPGQEVALSLEIAAGTARLRVRDTGAGIDPRLLRTIFEPFVQADTSLARTEGGLGLGLALVKGIVELHGGSVRADSAGKGMGTTFSVDLPLAPVEHEQDRAGRPREQSETARRVLIVDDNRDAADSLAQLVRLMGNEADVAYDAVTALAKTRSRLPDVVLCDIGLPGTDGYEVARQIRAFAGPRVRLVAVSGYAQPEDVARATDAGFDAHVAKPADPDRIEQLLR